MAIVKASKVQRDINDKILVTSAGLKEVQNQKIVKVKELIKEFDKTQDVLKKEEIEALIHQIDVLGQVIAYYNNLNDINKNGYITHNIKKQNDFVNDLTKAIQLIENANGAGSINSLKKDLNRVLLSSGENKYIFKGITGLSERIKNYADNIKKEQLQAQISYLPNTSDIGILSALTTNQLEQFYKVRTSNDLNTKDSINLMDTIKEKYVDLIRLQLDRIHHIQNKIQDEKGKTEVEVLQNLANKLFPKSDEKEQQKNLIDDLDDFKKRIASAVEALNTKFDKDLENDSNDNSSNFKKYKDAITKINDFFVKFDEETKGSKKKRDIVQQEYEQLLDGYKESIITVLANKDLMEDISKLSSEGRIINFVKTFTNGSLNNVSSPEYQYAHSLVKQQRMKTVSKLSFSNQNLDNVSSFLKINSNNNHLYNGGSVSFANDVDNVRRTNTMFNLQMKSFFKDNKITTNENYSNDLLIPITSGALEVTSVNRNMLSKVNKNSLSYLLFTNDEEKANLQQISLSVSQTIMQLNKLLFAFYDLDKKPNEYYQLKEEKEALEYELKQINELQQSLEGMKQALHYVKMFKDKMMNILSGGLTFLGIGAILHPMQMLMGVVNRSKENGQLRYNIALTDTAFGVTPSQSNIDDLSYYAPSNYFNATYGQIGYGTVGEIYRGLQSTVGGQKGNSPEENRRDIAWLSKNLVPDKEMFGDIGGMEQFLKTFYRDMGNSANEALTKLRTVERFAQTQGIPVSQLVSIFNSTNEAMRSVGVNADKYLDAMTSLIGVNGMRVEDANALVTSTANNAKTFSNDWARNIFWGLWNNPKQSTFDTLLSGVKSHDMHGNPIDSYYDNLVDRMFSEQNYFGSRWGGLGTALGQTDAFSHILDQGYTIKQAQEIMQMKEQGRDEELKAKLKGWDKLKNDPLALPHTTQDYTKQLSQAGEQLSEFTKIQATYIKFLNDLSFKFDKILSPELTKGLKAIEKIIAMFTNAMAELIRQIGGILNSPLGKMYTNAFNDSPLLTIAGTIVGLGALRFGAGKVLKGGFGAFKNVLSGKPSGISTGKAIATATAITAGVGLGAWNQYEGLQEQAQKMGNKDQKGQLIEMFQNGTAKATLIIGPGTQDKKDYTLIKYALALALAGASVATIASILGKISTKGKIKHQGILRRIKHLSSGLNKQAKDGKIPEKSERYKKLEEQKKKIEAEGKKLKRKKWQQYQREKRLYKQQVKQAKKIEAKNKAIMEKAKRLEQMRINRRKQLYNSMKWAKRLKYAKKGGLLALGGAFLASLFDKDVQDNRPIGDFISGLAGGFIGYTLGGSKGAALGAGIGAGAMELLRTNDVKAQNALNNYDKQTTQDSLAGLVREEPTQQQIQDQQKQASQQDKTSKKQSAQYNAYVKAYQQETEAYNKSKEMEIQNLSANKTSFTINESNETYTKARDAVLEKHGINWSKVADHEKRIWQNSYESFLQIFRDNKKALEMAAQALIKIQSMAGGGTGSIYTNASAIEYGNACYANAPADVKSWIDEASAKWNVPKWLIAGVLQIESGMNKNPSHSSAGAVGIAQFMPDTAAGFGFDPNDPHASVLGAAHYLRNLLDKYGGSAFKAVLAYNKGHYSDNWRNDAEQVGYVRKFHMIDSNNNPVPETEQTAGYVPISANISPNSHSNSGGIYSGVSGVDFSHLQWSGYVANDGWNHDVPGGSAEYIALDINRLTPKAKQRLNALTQLYAKYSNGGVLQWTVATLGHAEGTAHATGRKIDIARDSVDEEALIKAGNEAHVGVDREDSAHYDLLLEGTGSNNVGPVITERFSWDDANSNGGSGANPKLNLNLNLEDIKPKTLKEQWDENLRKYKVAVGNGKEVQGRIVNGLYVDPNQKFQSIEEIGKEIREKNIKQWGKLSDDIDTVEQSKQFQGLKNQESIDHEKIQMRFDKKQMRSDKIIAFTTEVKNTIQDFYEPSSLKISFNG